MLRGRKLAFWVFFYQNTKKIREVTEAKYCESNANCLILIYILIYLLSSAIRLDVFLREAFLKNLVL